MTTRAQLSQERSRLRRDDLLKAAIDLFSEGGSRAVTHRAVARRAGLPPATTTYYFASIDELLLEALADHIVHWRADLDTLSGMSGDSPIRPTMKVEDVTGIVRGVFAARGPEVAALELSIYLAAVRDDTLRDQARETIRGFEQLICRWLERLGLRDTTRLAGSLMALAGGAALRRQCGIYDEAEEAERLSEAIRDLVGAHVLGRDTIDGALAALADTP